MILYGTGLGPSPLVSISAYPIPKILAGTSVQITTSSGNTDAFVYYTSATQVAAIVPSTTQVGAANGYGHLQRQRQRIRAPHDRAKQRGPLHREFARHRTRSRHIH